MPNELLPVNQVAKEFLDVFTKVCGNDENLMRKVWYYMQIEFGGFPDTPEERKKAGII